MRASEPRDDFDANSQGSAWEAEGSPARDAAQERKAEGRMAKLIRKVKNQK